MIVTHGWPGSIIEQMKIIEPLTNPTDVRAQVMFSLPTDFENYTTFRNPGPNQEKALNTMLDQVVSWSTALKRVREKA